MDSYDILVLGGGAGGVAAAIRAAQLGGKVALVEEAFLGGLCMNRGCVPFGHMLAASHILGSLALGKAMGIQAASLSLDFPALLERQNELVRFMRLSLQGSLRKNNITVVTGKGTLAAPGKLAVKDQMLSYQKIILASGSRWLKPEVPNQDLPGVVNTDALLAAKALPKSCLVLGAGARSVEAAQLLHHFGCRVWLITPQDALLPAENKPIRTRLAKALQSQGIPVLTRTEVVGLEQTASGLAVRVQSKDREDTISVNRVISLRRGAALQDLGLQNIGLDPSGEYLRVNDRMETGRPGIFAVGDLSAPESLHYSHLASAGGIVAAQNAMGSPSAINRRAAVRVAYTRPQVACVGLTTIQAKEAGHLVVEGAAPLSMNPKGMMLSQTEGLVEVVAERKFGEILGIHCIGEHADEMAGAGVLALQMEATLEDLARASFPHPTLSESLAEAARDALGRSLYLP